MPVIAPGPPATINTRQQRSYPLPRRIRQLTPTHHKINCQTRPRRQNVERDELEIARWVAQEWHRNTGLGGIPERQVAKPAAGGSNVVSARVM